MLTPQGDSCQNGQVPFAGASEVNYEPPAWLCLSYRWIPLWDALTKLARRSKGQTFCAKMA